jgi:iron(III) transport system ATP-binding protein
MADVVLDGVAKRFGDVAVLDGLDLRVSDGRTLAIVGPSGCGKTTILRLIAGFERPDTGTIVIGGTMVSGAEWVPPYRRGIGYVPQEGGLFPHLTVGQNVTFGLDRAEASDQRLLELLDLVSLDPSFAGRRPDQLSGGEQARVALARAMAIRPRVMLLDEPFSALDADLRGETRDAVRRLLDSTGVTAIVVTHDREDAHDFADEVAVMEAGRVARIGPTAELYAERR